ncbi:DMT family transporter [Anaerovorax sp. IOR16]|uniref:DMT family transporter n=1 Tax=Anaerovorax sp. IOR16 TaxID=2773458 RepID=UPI0019D0FF86|nr:DMT family transporter [Anaerovorax sp. IOR16]
MNKKTLIGNIMLLTTSFIWGTAFVAQRVGMDHIEPFTFGASRYILATFALLPIIYFLESKKRKTEIANSNNFDFTPEQKKEERLAYLKGGATCGCVLFIASSLQQIGLVYTSAGKAGFITALYIVLVPIFGIFLKKKVRGLTWLGVLFATIGLYLLCIKEGFTYEFGDLIIFIGAFFWTGHILCCDYFTKKSDPVKLSCVQFFVTFVFSVIAAFLFESPTWAGIVECTIPIVYCGVFSAGIGYTLQMVAQKDTDPTIASLILSLEAVFGALGGYFLLSEILTIRELIGCAIMFAAIIIAQLPSKETETV